MNRGERGLEPAEHRTTGAADSWRAGLPGRVRRQSDNDTHRVRARAVRARVACSNWSGFREAQLYSGSHWRCNGLAREVMQKREEGPAPRRRGVSAPVLQSLCCMSRGWRSGSGE